jgi:hypothetical protein
MFTIPPPAWRQKVTLNAFSFALLLFYTSAASAASAATASAATVSFARFVDR